MIAEATGIAEAVERLEHEALSSGPALAAVRMRRSPFAGNR